MVIVWLPLFEAFIKVWLPCGYAWLPILNPYRKSVATRAVKKKIFKQVNIRILRLSLSYIKCGYRVAIIIRGFYKVWLPCSYAWLPILNPYRKSVATRVVMKKIFKQVTIRILHLSLSYTKCGYRVATIVRGLY